MADGRRFAILQHWNERLSRGLNNSTNADRAMNKPLQHDTRAAIVYMSLCETVKIAQAAPRKPLSRSDTTALPTP
jgi:hypothetical protein